jgi:putative flippase GtrA
MLPEAIAKRSAGRLTHLFRAFLVGRRWSLARYAVAGVLISIGYTITVILLVEAVPALSPSWASVISFVVWTPVSYIGHRDFTFRSDSGPAAHAPLKFFLTFALRFVMSGVAVFVVTDFLHLHYLFGVLTNWVALPAISYAVMRFWVFEGWQSPDSEVSPPVRPVRRSA